MHKQHDYTKLIPFGIYLVSLGLIYQTSMIGSYIIGVDIHTEYYVANHILENGWNWDWANNSNTSIVLGLLVPFFNKIGIPVVWQFKAIFPAICALSPVIMYFAFKKHFGIKKSVLASIFLMIMPMFTMEAVSMVKSQVAYMFVSLFVLFLVRIENLKYKIPGLILSASGAVLSHYSVGLILVAYALGIAFIGSLLSIKKPKMIYVSCSLLIIPLVYFGYYSIISQGSIARVTLAIGGNIKQVTSDVIAGDNSSLINQYEEHTAANVTQSTTALNYLNKQSPLVKMAIGLDFMQASAWGKVFRIVQYTTEILLIIGLFILIKNRSKYPRLYIASVLSSFLILAGCVFIPFLTTTLSPTRFYMATLFFIAPVITLALRPRYTAIVLLAYFIFTSGLVFELTKSTITERIDTPYAMSLSNDRVKIVGVYDENDIAAIKWITSQPRLAVYTDYLGTSLILGYDASGINCYTEPKNIDHYILQTSWNYRNWKKVDGWFEGRRVISDWEDIKADKIVFAQGDTRVYFVEGENVD